MGHNWARESAPAQFRALPVRTAEARRSRVEQDKAEFKSSFRNALAKNYERLEAESLSLQAWAEKHPEEVRACALLMDVFGIRGYGKDGQAVYEQRDDGQEDRIHDFDLRLPDGCRAAVEVTRDIDPAVRQFETMVSNEAGHLEGFSKISLCLDHHWHIDIEPSPGSTPQQAVRAIQNKIEGLLKAPKQRARPILAPRR